MQNEIFQQICSSAREILNLSEADSITMESRLKDDLGLDSMSTLSFLMSLEDNLPGFAVDPDTLDANHLETVASVMEYVSSEMNMAA